MVRIFKARIFALTVLFSIAAHIFWLSMIKVVMTPKETAPIKFSKVSFLGPILERGVPDLAIEPRERSFLEKRYLHTIVMTPLVISGSADESPRSLISDRARGAGSKSDTYVTYNKKLIFFIEEAVSDSKAEPLSGME